MTVSNPTTIITRNPSDIMDTMDVLGRTLTAVSRGTMTPVLYWSATGISVGQMRDLGIVSAHLCEGFRVDGGGGLVALYGAPNGHSYERHVA